MKTTPIKSQQNVTNIKKYIYIIYDDVQVELIYHNKISIYRASMLLFKIIDNMYKTLNITDQY